MTRFVDQPLQLDTSHVAHEPFRRLDHLVVHDVLRLGLPREQDRTRVHVQRRAFLDRPERTVALVPHGRVPKVPTREAPAHLRVVRAARDQRDPEPDEVL